MRSSTHLGQGRTEVEATTIPVSSSLIFSDPRGSGVAGEAEDPIGPQWLTNCALIHGQGGLWAVAWSIVPLRAAKTLNKPSVYQVCLGIRLCV